MFYKSGVLDLDYTKISPNNTAHAVVGVGFDVNFNWIIRNSWGTEWGLYGYAILSGKTNSIICNRSHLPFI